MIQIKPKIELGKQLEELASGKVMTAGQVESLGKEMLVEMSRPSGLIDDSHAKGQGKWWGGQEKYRKRKQSRTGALIKRVFSGKTKAALVDGGGNPSGLVLKTAVDGRKISIRIHPDLNKIENVSQWFTDIRKRAKTHFTKLATAGIIKRVTDKANGRD